MCILSLPECESYLHQIKSCHLIDRSIRNDAVLLGVDDGRADEAGQEQVSAHGSDLTNLQPVHARQRFVHLRHDPPQAVRKTVRVLFEIANEFVDQSHQLGLVGINHLLDSLLELLCAFLSKQLFLLDWGESLNQLVCIDFQVVFIFNQKLHDRLVQGRSKEKFCREESFREKLEQDAEGAGASPQQPPGVVALLQLKLDEVPQHLQQVTLVLLHDAVAINGGEDCVNDTLRVVLVELLSSNQAGCNEPGVLSQSAQEFSISSLLEPQLLVSIHKLRVLQDFCVLATFSRRSFSALKKNIETEKSLSNS